MRDLLWIGAAVAAVAILARRKPTTQAGGGGAGFAAQMGAGGGTASGRVVTGILTIDQTGGGQAGGGLEQTGKGGVIVGSYDASLEVLDSVGVVQTALVPYNPAIVAFEQHQAAKEQGIKDAAWARAWGQLDSETAKQRSIAQGNTGWGIR